MAFGASWPAVAGVRPAAGAAVLVGPLSRTPRSRGPAGTCAGGSNGRVLSDVGDTAAIYRHVPVLPGNPVVAVKFLTGRP
jgi:hypothetical protein